MDSKPLVRVRQGNLWGKETTTYNGRKYYSFEGIPYAKPPCGKLRFMAPEPPEQWQGIRDATKPGSRCAQIDPYRPSKFQGSEDCLYLNVYTPVLKENGKKLPVIFYVHGGRYIVGYGDYYRPDFFLQQDVVVVTINYRLHILGFLCLHTAEVPGNVGLKDIVAALKWVKDNIDVFNGDPCNVTAFGESAGSGSVTALIASEMSNNLFHKAIVESGTCLSDLFMKNEDKIAKAEYVVGKLGFKAKNVENILEILQTVDIEELVKATVYAQNAHTDINAFFMPVIERRFVHVKNFFVEDPWVLYSEGRIKKMPIISGIMAQEGAYFLKTDSKGNIIYDNNIENYIPRNFGIPKGSRRSILMAEKLRSFYFGGKKPDENNKEIYLQFISDAYFDQVFTVTADYLSKNNPNVYFFRFNFDGNLNTRLLRRLGVKGATHGDVLPYQFYRKNKMDQCTEKDLEVIKFMSEALTSFAKTGSPSWSGQKTKWLPYDETKGMCVDISDEIRVIPYVSRERVNFWKRLRKEQCRL